MMMTGRPGRRACTFASRSMPEPPGMRMSLTSTCGVVASSSAASTSRALVKLRVGELLARQRLLQHEADGLVVVNDPDGFHASVAPGAASAQGSGIRILKSVRPGTLSHSIVPWCCCTKVCASVSPSPEPPSRPDTSG